MSTTLETKNKSDLIKFLQQKIDSTNMKYLYHTSKFGIDEDLNLAFEQETDEFNEELEKDPNKLSAILTEDLYRTKLSESGKVDINNDTIEYNNFYQVKDNRHSPTELYFIIDTPIIGIKYDLLTIQCNNEATDSYDYLFNKILKKRD